MICQPVLRVHRIKDVQKKEKTKPRPQALNTVEMLRVASSGLGLCCNNCTNSRDNTARSPNIQMRTLCSVNC